MVPVDADAGNLKLDGNENEQSPDDDDSCTLDLGKSENELGLDDNKRCALDMDKLELESDENEFDVELEATVCMQGLTSSSDSTFHIPGAISEQFTD